MTSHLTIEREPVRKKIFVFGASGHARVVLDILDQEGKYNVVGLLDDHKPVGGVFCGRTVVGSTVNLPQLTQEFAVSGVLVAVGDNWTRARVVNDIRAQCADIEFVNTIHPAAVISPVASVAQGVVIMAGALVGPGSSIGEFCILNTRASLDHDCIMDEFSSMGPTATTGGGVHIGAFSNIGIGATVLQEISIGKHTVIGAGAVVFKKVPDQVVAYGTPARVVRSRQAGDRYLTSNCASGGNC